VDHGLIFFNFETTSWDWDEEGITKLELSKDITEYLVQNTLQNTIQKETVEVLKPAACLGSREFNTLILSSVVGLSAVEVDYNLLL
jgi:predicted ATPase